MSEFNLDEKKDGVDVHKLKACADCPHYSGVKKVGTVLLDGFHKDPHKIKILCAVFSPEQYIKPRHKDKYEDCCHYNRSLKTA